jgi:anti-anti-sigma regulatory factor
MLIKKREVRVHQILTRMTAKEEAALLVDLARYAETECPCIVLNCSNIFTMHRSTLHLLLSCLEVAMKCKGDVRLAALPPVAEALLRHMGITRLFEIYATSEAAVQSFYQRPHSIAGTTTFAKESQRDLEYAA